jgi:RNA polymerase sigma-70 factor (ECF subfamily)
MSTDERRSPEELLAGARAGGAECLGALLELYRNYLQLLARTQLDLHLQGRAGASDLVQETFLRACDHFDQFRGDTEKELMGWLRRILLNCLARLVEREVRAQKRDRRRQVSLEMLERSSINLEAALASPHSSPSAQVRRRELAALVADQLARLPADYREVIVLRNLEGLPFDEVARRMGRTPGAVRVLWLRALDRMRQWHEGESLT